MNGIFCNRSFKVSGPGQTHRPTQTQQSRRTHHASQQADWTGGFSVTINQVFSGVAKECRCATGPIRSRLTVLVLFEVKWSEEGVYVPYVQRGPAGWDRWGCARAVAYGPTLAVLVDVCDCSAIVQRLCCDIPVYKIFRSKRFALMPPRATCVDRRHLVASGHLARRLRLSRGAPRRQHVVPRRALERCAHK